MSYGNLCCLQFLPFSFNTFRKVKIQVFLDIIIPITPHCSINAMSQYPSLFSRKNYNSIQQVVFTHFFLFTTLLLFFLLRLCVLVSTISSCVCITQRERSDSKLYRWPKDACSKVTPEANPGSQDSREGTASPNTNCCTTAHGDTPGPYSIGSINHWQHCAPLSTKTKADRHILLEG